MRAFQLVLVVKNLPANAGYMRCTYDSWVKKIPWGGHGNPFQYSRLKSFMNRGTWWATVHRVAKGQTQPHAIKDDSFYLNISNYFYIFICNFNNLMSFFFNQHQNNILDFGKRNNFCNLHIQFDV